MINNDEKLYARVMDGALEKADKPSAVAALILAQVAAWKSSARGVYMSGAGKAPDWLEFEFRTWELGEAIRQILQKRRAWRTEDCIIGAIIMVAEDKELGRGREPFVELIGRFAYQDGSDLLFSFLSEPAMVGHAIKALRLGRVPEASDKVKGLLKTEKRGWVKKEMKKYISLWD